MRVIALLTGLVALSTCTTLGRASPSPYAPTKGQSVIDLNKENFDEVIGPSEFALVLFYSPTCGYCTNMRVPYIEAADHIKKMDPNIRIAAIDVMAEPELGDRFEIQGFPTLKWFVNGRYHSDFKGKREKDIFVDYIRTMIKPKTVEITTVEELTAKEAERSSIIVGYFDALNTGLKEVTTFAKLSVKHEEVLFLETTDAKVAEAAGINSKPAVSMIRNFNGLREVVPLDAKPTRVNVLPFIMEEMLPQPVGFSKATGGAIFSAQIEKHIILWTKNKDLVPKSPLMKAFTKLAKEYKGKLVWVTVDNDNEEDSAPITQHFNLSVSPTIFGYWLKEGKKYYFNGEPTETKLRQFAEDFLGNKMAPWYASAPLPAEPTEDGVTVVVGKNFEDIVFDDTKDVLLYVYHDECKECKEELETTYPKLASRFSKTRSVLIAKCDAMLNEHEILRKRVKSFPTVLFFPAVPSPPTIIYGEEGRTLLHYTRFLQHYSKIKFELPKKKKSGKAVQQAEDEDEYEDEMSGQKDEL